MGDTDLTLRAFGLDVAVTLDAAHEESLRRQWQWCLPGAELEWSIAPLPTAPTNAAPVDEPFTLRHHVPTSGDADAVHAADYQLTTALTGAAITRRAGEFLMLHAGGVCDQETGRVAALVAASGTGKTTATRHFCTHGYGYVTDESLIFNDLGEILPYPKPLSVVLDPSDPHHKAQHGPEDLGLVRPADGPLTLGPLVLLERLRGDVDTDVEVPRLRPVHLFEGLSKILPQSSAVPNIPDCLDLLGRVAMAAGGVHELTYREIADTEPLLREAFSAPAQEPFWRHVPGTWSDADGSRYAVPGSAQDAHADSGLADASFVRAPFTDALVDDDSLDALLLVGATPALLGGIGTFVWLACDGPRDSETLTLLCEEAFGAHPDARRLVQETLLTMLRSGVLRRVDEHA